MIMRELLIYLDILLTCAWVVLTCVGVVCLRLLRKDLLEPGGLARYLKITMTTALISVVVSFILVLVGSSHAWIVGVVVASGLLIDSLCLWISLPAQRQ